MRAPLATRLSELPLLAASLAVLGLVGYCWVGRIAYPFDLEWMEGGLLQHAARVLDGQPIYVRPSPDFIPYIYPPLYTWLVAALGALVGLAPWVGRAVSIVGTLAAAAAAVDAVRAEGRPLAFAIGAAGLYMSCYDDSGYFYDLVRIDGLFMGLLSWSLVLARRAQVAPAGLLLALAFATKHNAAAFGLPTVLWLGWQHGRQVALRYAAWSAGPALAFVVAMQAATGGLFLTWILGVPAAHGMVGSRAFPGAPKELFLVFPAALGLAGIVALAGLRRRSPAGVYWAAQAGLGLGLCMLMRGHTGGFINVLMPGHWTLAVGAVLALTSLLKRWPHLALRFGLAALLAAEIGHGLWDPKPVLPTPADTAAGYAVVERLRQIDGEVLSPYAPSLPVLAGKKPGFALIALWDIDHAGGPFDADVGRIKKALAEHRYAAIVASQDDKMGYGLKEFYQKGDRLPVTGRALYPKSGYPRRPTNLWVPREDGAAPPAEAPPEAPAEAGAAEGEDPGGGP